MITIAGIELPQSAYWSGEMSYGLPVTEYETDTNGTVVAHGAKSSADIDIIIPRAADGLKRSDLIRLSGIAQNMSEVNLIINDRMFAAVFRYGEKPLDMNPLNARQAQRDTDSYYGTIRLKEI